jgi:hypothetical protein
MAIKHGQEHIIAPLAESLGTPSLSTVTPRSSGIRLRRISKKLSSLTGSTNNKSLRCAN